MATIEELVAQILGGQQRRPMGAVPFQDDPGFENPNQVRLQPQNTVGSDLQRLVSRGQTAGQRRAVVPGSRVPLPKRVFEPASQEELSQNRLQYAYDKLGIIDNYDTTPGYGRSSDYLERAEDIMFRANQIRQRNAIQRASGFGGGQYVVPGQGGGGIGGGGGNGRFADFVRAIAGKESGGNYGAVNPHSGALGKYQIMPSNLAGTGGWDMEILGRNITPQQFLSSPRLQERIARGKLKQYYNRYGVRGAASAWYSGDPNKWRNKSPQGGYPSIYAYVMSILNAMGLR